MIVNLDEIRTNKNVSDEVMLGERLCKKLKCIYHEDMHWKDCHHDVTNKLKLLNKILRKFYSENDHVAVLKRMQSFDRQNFEEVFALEKDVLVDDKKDPEKKYGDNVIWVPIPKSKTGLYHKVRKMLTVGQSEDQCDDKI